jgi:hypothetical protein
MKILNLIITVLIFTTFVYASNEGAPEPKTTTISGQVVDNNTGEALAGVKVLVSDLDKVVYTDFEGNFAIENLTPGTYKIQSSLISYNDSSMEVDCSEKGDNLKITLDNK